MRATEAAEWWMPRPLMLEGDYDEWRYEVSSVTYLEHPNVPVGPSFFSVLESRRSIRPSKTLTEAQLSALLWFAAKTRASARPGASRWEHRSAPSAGGRHPVELLLLNWPTDSDSMYRYDSIAHALSRLQVAESDAVAKLVAAAKKATGSEDGVIVWYAAHCARTTSKYEHGESLVWRDAGALVGVMALVAEALGLACCPIGPTGEPVISAALRSNNEIAGVGGCVVGAR